MVLEHCGDSCNLQLLTEDVLHTSYVVVESTGYFTTVSQLHHTWMLTLQAGHTSNHETELS